MPGLAQSVLNYGRGALGAARGYGRSAANVAVGAHLTGMARFGGTGMAAMYGAGAGAVYGGTLGRDPGQSFFGGALTGAMGGAMLGAGGYRYGRPAYTAGRAAGGLRAGLRSAGTTAYGMARVDAMGTARYIGNSITRARNRFRALGR